MTPSAKWRWPRGWLQAGLATVAMLSLARQERLVMGFVANDCANGTNRVDAYSLLESATCPTHAHRDELLNRVGTRAITPLILGRFY